MSLAAKNLCYAVDSSFRGHKIYLLKDATVTAPASLVTAIMGPSGAGKTTLMNLLSGTTTTGYCSGEILVNGVSLGSNLKSAVAHVECFDFHIEEFTVMQNLYFAALLRVSEHVSYAECIDCCREIASIMHLTPVLDVIVGSDLHKGISGGQKKLLSIAIELLSFPTVLCMDEPTSGLDAATSLQLAQTLRELAQDHTKTILCTVHQPSAAMLTLWDHLILVGGGGVVYEGLIANVGAYMTRIGHVIGEDHKYNPVEYFVELLSDADETNRLKQLWLTEHSTHEEDVELNMDSNHTDIAKRGSLSLWKQTWILTQRHALYTLLNLHGAKGMFARNILGGFFYGIMYRRNGQELWDLDFLVTPERGDGLYLSPYLYNSVTFCFSVPLYIVFINMVPIPAMFSMKRYCDKEQANKLYSSFARWISLILVDIPVLFLGTSCFIAITLLMSGFRQSWYHYGLVVMFASVCGYAQAQLCAHVSGTAIQGFVLMAVLSCLQLLFSGYIITYSDMPDWLEWGVFGSFMRFCTGQLMSNEFSNYLGYQGDLILYFWDYQHFKFWRTRNVLFFYYFGLELLVLCTLLLPKSHVTRMPAEDNNEAAGAILSSDTGNPLSAADTDNFEGAKREGDVEHKSFNQERTHGDDGVSLEQGDIFQASRQLPKSCEVTFVFKEVVYTLKDSSRKDLLKGISGVVRPGELCAVMGLSGSGKTTLLNVLSGKTNAGVVGGEILANGAAFPGMKVANSMSVPQVSPTYAYVMQDDAHFPLFTVKETLEFAAMLRQRTANVVDVQDMVAETLNVLGLRHISDHYVGTIGKSMISRGQLRRLTVGVEVVHSPSMIFCDEPTTGLDSFLASTVVHGLRTLAAGGRTVFCTIHSPAPALFSQFDTVLLLSEGHTLFFGPTSACKDYLQSRCDFVDNKIADCSPADFIIEVALNLRDRKESCKQSIVDLAVQAKDYATSKYPDFLSGPVTSVEKHRVLMQDGGSVCREDGETSIFDAIVEVVTKNIIADVEDIRKAPVTLRILLVREFLKEYRRYWFWVVTFFRSIALGVVIGGTWGDIQTDFSVLNLVGLFLTIFICMNLWMVELVPTMQDDKVIFYRERDANATSTFSSWLVVGIAAELSLIVIVFVMTLTVYWMTNLRYGSHHFAVFYISSYLTLLANLHLGRFISTLTPNTMVNVLIFPPLTMTIQAMLCGYACMISTLPDWFQWLTSIDSAKWCMGIQFINELQGTDKLVADYHSLLNDFGWNYPMRDQFSFLVYLLVTCKFLTYLGMRYHSSSKQ